MTTDTELIAWARERWCEHRGPRVAYKGEEVIVPPSRCPPAVVAALLALLSLGTYRQQCPACLTDKYRETHHDDCEYIAALAAIRAEREKVNG